MGTTDEKYPSAIKCAPKYPDNKSYFNIFGGDVLWDGDGWQEESMSWKESCYIHSGLSTCPETVFVGPDAQKLLSMVSINDVYDWPINKSKHLVMCDEHGWVANHCLAVRDGEDAFRTFCDLPWAEYQLSKHPELDVNCSKRWDFNLQLGGPKSLTVLEAAIQQDCHDLGFLEVRPVELEGFEGDFEICRIGMVGTLAYELRGPLDLVNDVYDLVYQAGLPYGIKRLGWRTYVVNHTEGGFPQLNCTFTIAGILYEDYMENFSGRLQPFLSGSIDPANIEARLRTPQDCDWDWMAKFNHDFIGREAVEAAVANPTKKLVTLRWNADDFADIFASFTQEGEPYKMFEFPCGQPAPAGGHVDLVTKDGEQVGLASVPVYSLYYHAVISHATLDIDQAEIGNEVIVHWGDYGKRIKEVRATVERYPYLDLESNRVYDTSQIPSGLQ